MKLPSINPGHRGDVQALRAVAVILVILYHLKIIKGGFLGVDKPPSDSVACLSANPSTPTTCDFPVQSIIKFRTSSIDPTPWLCTDICPAVLNGFNTYRDGSHISVITAKNLSEKLYLELLKYNR